jgi:hypothetical protein
MLFAICWYPARSSRVHVPCWPPSAQAAGDPQLRNFVKSRIGPDAVSWAGSAPAIAPLTAAPPTLAIQSHHRMLPIPIDLQPARMLFRELHHSICSDTGNHFPVLREHGAAVRRQQPDEGNGVSLNLSEQCAFKLAKPPIPAVIGASGIVEGFRRSRRRPGRDSVSPRYARIRC